MNNKATEHIDPFVNLGRRLRDEARGVGLSLENFVLTPNLDGENHVVTGWFLLDDEDTETDTETTEAFDQLVAGQGAVEDDDKLNSAHERFREMDEQLRDPNKGLGLDDD